MPDIINATTTKAIHGDHLPTHVRTTHAERTMLLVYCWVVTGMHVTCELVLVVMFAVMERLGLGEHSTVTSRINKKQKSRIV